MTDHLTAAILAAARLDDTAAAKHLGHVVDLNEPHAVARVTAGRPSLRASMERSGYLASDHDDESAVDLILRAQTEPNPEILYARLARRGFPLLAAIAQRSREALDAASGDSAPMRSGHAVALAIRAQAERDHEATLARIDEMGYPRLRGERRSRSTFPAEAFAVDDQPQTVVRGATLTTPPITPDDVIPDDSAEWHPYSTREEWDAACDETARRLGGPL